MVIPTVQTFAGNPYVRIKDYFLPFQKPKQSISFNTKEGGSFNFSNGFNIKIPKEAFTDQDGKPVNEHLSLVFQEHFSKRDLFFQDKSTLAAEKLLDISSIIDINIPKNQLVGLKLEKAINISAPLKNLSKTNNIQLFEEKSADTKAVFAHQELDWKASTTNIFIQKKGNLGRLATFHLTKFGSYAIGKKAAIKKQQKKAMFSVVLNDTDQKFEDSRAFLIFQESNSIVRLRKQRQRFSGFHLPAGRKATLLVIGLKESQFYFYKYNIPKLTSQSLKVSLKALSLSELNQKLQYLNF